MKSTGSTRRPLRYTAAALTSLVLTWAGIAAAAGPAAAAAAQHQPAVVGASQARLGPIDCVFAVGRFKVSLGIPRPEGVTGPIHPSQRRPTGSVAATGHVDVTDNRSCSKAKVQFSIQRKVCGFWGCTWKDLAKTHFLDLPEYGRVPADLSVACRTGEHSYRMYARVSWVEVVFDNRGTRWYGGLEPKMGFYNGRSEKIHCDV
ncbi:hypothetical protein HD597_012920 [Nonomuraea thailandensis]|uniref:Secreted protein n=1 Tax=Nonomuraea thailandensis TaxID=1188745 RepID=A0A9X2KD77_9ACTN|nr:hypothetical protein [Nonomuraea thailandensis]MCP2365816.1 hypothetical protein [Nonomuraea thailandensis]